MQHTPIDIVVCIGHHPKTAALLKAAKALAEQNQCRWCALHVELPEYAHGYSSQQDEYRQRILRFLTLAENMGADVTQIEGRTVLEGLLQWLDYRKKRHLPVRHIVIGKSNARPWYQRWRAPMAERMMRRAPHDCMVHVVSLTQARRADVRKRFWPGHIPQLKDILAALLAVGIATLGAEMLRSITPSDSFAMVQQNISLLYILACIIIALRYGLFAGLVAAGSSFLIINFFYVLPFYQLALNDVSDLINFCLFISSAATVSLLGSMTRQHIRRSMEREQRSQLLYRLHRQIHVNSNRMEALQVIHQEVSNVLPTPIAFFMPPEGNPDALELIWPQDMELSDQDIQALLKCWAEIRTTGIGTYDLSRTLWRFEPLSTPRGEIGVIGAKAELHHRLDSAFGKWLSLLADQSASILERVDMNQQMGEVRFREEREKLRSMLLSAVSHDLKTPLASIIGSLSVYRSMRQKGILHEEQAEILTDTALDEAQRLDSFISNILDMTRLESGDVELKKEWHEPEELLNRVHKRLRQRLRNHQVEITLSETPHDIEVDVITAEQVLQNVMDNAAKYSPEQSRIDIRMVPDPPGFSFYIKDSGQGIAIEGISKIFDKYERLQHADSHVAGTGLGLAICKTIMGAQGGEISASNHPEGGAEFRIYFPKSRPRHSHSTALEGTEAA